jgi:nucleoid DNA-binding protein
MARNPTTGESVPLHERAVPVVKPSPEFLKMVNINLNSKNNK